jgi:hypothetical protein
MRPMEGVEEVVLATSVFGLTKRPILSLASHLRQKFRTWCYELIPRGYPLGVAIHV